MERIEIKGLKSYLRKQRSSNMSNQDKKIIEIVKNSIKKKSEYIKKMEKNGKTVSFNYNLEKLILS
jgi:hypothetical protein